MFMSTSAKRMLVATASAVIFLSHLVLAVQADGTSTITLLATQDTFINSSLAPIFGDDTMVVGYNSVAGDMRALVQFSLGDIPEQAIVESATLRVWYRLCSFSSACADMDASIHRLTQSWDEETATWRNMGEASGARRYDTQTIGGYHENDTWVEWDVTALVKEWHSGTWPNQGLAIHGQEGPPENYKVFSTKEKGAWWEPRLVVELYQPAPTPTVTPTPTAHANAHDNAHANGYADVHTNAHQHTDRDTHTHGHGDRHAVRSDGLCPAGSEAVTSHGSGSPRASGRGCLPCRWWRKDSVGWREW